MKLLALVCAAAVLFGDAAVAATIAGSFSVLNMFLNAWLIRRVERTGRRVEHTSREVARTRKVLEAPRRVLYDQDGKPFGTVLALQDDDSEWTITKAGRRHDDEGEAAP